MQHSTDVPQQTVEVNAVQSVASQWAETTTVSDLHTYIIGRLKQQQQQVIYISRLVGVPNVGSERRRACAVVTVAESSLASSFWSSLLSSVYLGGICIHGMRRV